MILKIFESSVSKNQLKYRHFPKKTSKYGFNQFIDFSFELFN